MENYQALLALIILGGINPGSLVLGIILIFGSYVFGLITLKFVLVLK